MSKSKRPWHICDDCLSPIADSIAALLLQMRQPGKDDVLPVLLDGVLRDHHFEFGVTWLKICVSVEFANDVWNTLSRPIKRYTRLHSIACRRIASTLKEPAYIQHIAITRAIEFDWAIARSKGLNEDERPESDVENQYSLCQIQLQKAVEFLRQSAAVLRAMIERRKLRLKEIPPTGIANAILPEHRTIALSATDAGCIWRGIDPSSTKKKEREAARKAFMRALDSIPHERVGKKFVLDSSKLPSSSIQFLPH